MSDSAAAGAQKDTKKKMAGKRKKPVEHPKYSEMIRAAVEALKDRGGSSRQAILKYIGKHYNVGADEKIINQHLKMSLRAGVKSGSLKQAKGTGASGSFRLGESARKGPAKKAKTKVAKKPVAEKKARSPAKKAKSPKKAKVAKPKKATAKPKKAAAKPKKATTKTKKPAAKAKAKKATAKK